MSAFTSSLLASNPSIPGLERSIVISPRRLHLTLGVVSLSQAGSSPDAPPHTLEDASYLLHSLQPRVIEILRGQKLTVGLEIMDIMKPERGGHERAHVLYVGPDLNREHGRRLRAVCELVHREFIKAGLVVDERRPLKLHCTVLNTTYRKGKRREPFSYRAVLASEAVRNILTTGGVPEDRGPVNVNLGTWDVDEIQICEMSSWGPEGEYVRAAECALV
ncbi:hypothetical protein BV25DRAFT_1832272 [Artomyces pyxidatus]|uniref:Uncharacterized protein n=1 Tax=Artomyces pyxidatus TaxID=48021 RepID=A0ACB8SL19_9AGAM|nr:hypothetical protein BV25DRAFT_1832272 [Artomyces pyxidatus]